MKQDWGRKRLGDICGFVRGPFGGSLKKNNFKPDGYAVYEQQHAIYDQFNDIRYFIDDDKFNEMKRFELNSGDLIMSCSGTMGKIAIVPENIKKGIINQALLKLSPSKMVSNNFLKLWMQSESFQDSLKEYSGGAAIQNVASVAILKNIEIPLPPLPEQQCIVAILDKAFATIAKAKANAEQSLKNARELFDSYLQSVLTDKKWVRKQLGDVCYKVEYGASSKSKNDGKLPVLRMGNIQNGRFVWDSLVYSDNKEDNQQYLLKYNDVLFNRTNSPELVGKTAIYKGETPAIFAGYLIRIHRKEDLLDADYLNYYLNSAMAMEYGKTVVISSVNQANINGTKLKTYPIPLPSLTQQQAIVQKLDALDAKTKKLEAIYQQKINDLEELKKSILQKAFSGELNTDKDIAT
ncbi:restriction endonuclease subunit S [Nitrosomonas oligotropha]|uniref:Type I restriction enzyme, S subunit n=1 Tax=Nitrosomonas oligotropha TaxID=42354 RepID=A0A1H8UL17_9PROT|nr:restriction endonuclease subunit S [Nitrosomonas oligotropha]SDW16493.1 type I restriction enzyme, S subunit [Nitrosomonas oligotropha]SEP03930.1 type I restriction enzyme, S subunit [Nitrosomonas oligotropha]